MSSTVATYRNPGDDTSAKERRAISVDSCHGSGTRKKRKEKKSRRVAGARASSPRKQFHVRPVSDWKMAAAGDDL